MMSSGPHRLAGTTLIEAIVALVLGLFVLHLGLDTVGALRRSQARLESRQDALVALRVARHVLRTELGWADGTRDWSADVDSLSLRAFRGTGVICGTVSSTEVTVAYRGARAPDPTKDSLEVLYADGTVRYVALAAALAPGGAAVVGCEALAEDGAIGSWRFEPALPPGPVVARVFERGSYHLTGSALRYRRGASGRQPLTPEVWIDASTGFRLDGTGVVLEVTPRTDAGPPWRGLLSWVRQ
ncbi:MAG: hypothetical protein O2956_09275 [Gemmatimonadetes bacterium]|nr:hypothetical protein [Gemmatimonadota bacterium]